MPPIGKDWDRFIKGFEEEEDEPVTALWKLFLLLFSGWSWYDLRAALWAAWS
jgi:hypothetical protein